MKIAGIVAEYNPFHLGHAYHIAETKRLVGEDCGIVCVMSGNFTQRGSAAVFEKHARAAAAVSCGADLVVELPLPFAVSSAEGFASGALVILSSFGSVSFLSFGSECGNAERLDKIAGILLSADFPLRLSESLRNGCSFPAARQRAAESIAGECLPELSDPNDILGIEYLKTCRRMNFDFQIIAVKRQGAGHDKTGCESFRSAAELRGILLSGDSVSDYVPHSADMIFQKEISEGRGPVGETLTDQIMLSRLRMLSRETLLSLPDVSEGIDDRLYRCIRESTTVEELYLKLKTKRYPLSRIRRLVLSAVLGLPASLRSSDPAYLRVLASNQRGLSLLREAERRASLPVITNAGQVRDLSSEAQRFFQLESDATDLYTLAFPLPEQRVCELDWRTPPVILP